MNMLQTKIFDHIGCLELNPESIGEGSDTKLLLVMALWALISMKHLASPPRWHHPAMPCVEWHSQPQAEEVAWGLTGVMDLGAHGHSHCLKATGSA